MTATKITQADRDAAEAYREKVLDAIWANQPEDQVLLEAFARHRMEERAAIVAWLRRHKIGNFPFPVVETLEISNRQKALVDAVEAGEHLK